MNEPTIFWLRIWCSTTTLSLPGAGIPALPDIVCTKKVELCSQCIWHLTTGGIMQRKVTRPCCCCCFAFLWFCCCSEAALSQFCCCFSVCVLLLLFCLFFEGKKGVYYLCTSEILSSSDGSISLRSTTPTMKLPACRKWCWLLTGQRKWTNQPPTGRQVKRERRGIGEGVGWGWGGRLAGKWRGLGVEREEEGGWPEQ